MADIAYPTALKTDHAKLGAVYSLIEQMRLEHNRQGAIARGNPNYFVNGVWHSYQQIYKLKQRSLLLEQIKLRKKIRESVLPDEEWTKLSLDEQHSAMQAVLPVKAEEKVKETEANTALLDELKAIYLSDIQPVSLRDPSEDFTSANWNNGSPQADPNSRFTITESKVDIDSITRDEVAYHYRTHTVSGDFEWLFTLSHGGGTYQGSCGAACGADNIGHHGTGNRQGFEIYLSSSTSEQFYLVDLSSGSYNDEDYEQTSGDPPHVRYVTMDRTGSTLTAYLYTDAQRTILSDTISISCQTDDWDYLYSACSRDTSQPAKVVSFYIEDWDLQEVSETEKTASDSGTGADAVTAGSPAATAAGTETGQGTDTKTGYPDGEITGSESGSGNDTTAILEKAIYASESGGGAESSSLETGDVTNKYGAETGSGADTAELTIARTGYDSGSGSEESVVSPVFFADDTGLGEELSVLIKDAFGFDTGDGEDTLKALVGAAGVSTDMRLPGRRGAAGVPSKKVRMPSKGVNI